MDVCEKGTFWVKKTITTITTTKEQGYVENAPLLIPLDPSPNLVPRSYLVTVEGQGRRLPLPPPPLLPLSL